MVADGPASSQELQESQGPQFERRWAARWLRHHADLVRYVTHLLSGDVHGAEDVAQDVAVRLWQHPEVLQDDEPLAGWLRTVARNIVIDRARRRKVRPPEVPLGPGVDPVVPDRLDLVDETSSIRTLLADLSPAHRRTVIEVYVRDRPVAEVAAELGVPAGTVKSRCHTAVHRLRASVPSPSLCA